MSAISMVATKPGDRRDPSVLLTEMPSCTWVSIADTDAAAADCAESPDATIVRPEADKDTASPSIASYQRPEFGAQRKSPPVSNHEMTCCTRITGRVSAGRFALPANTGCVVGNATSCPSAEMAGAKTSPTSVIDPGRPTATWTARPLLAIDAAITDGSPQRESSM